MLATSISAGKHWEFNACNRSLWSSMKIWMKWMWDWKWKDRKEEIKCIEWFRKLFIILSLFEKMGWKYPTLKQFNFLANDVYHMRENKKIECDVGKQKTEQNVTFIYLVKVCTGYWYGQYREMVRENSRKKAFYDFNAACIFVALTVYNL